MRDARYLRGQAEWCLELARLMSDRKVADSLKAEAARYHAEALAMEAGESSGQDAANGRRD
jgi:hypothetical protein